MCPRRKSDHRQRESVDMSLFSLGSVHISSTLNLGVSMCGISGVLLIDRRVECRFALLLQLRDYMGGVLSFARAIN